MIVCLICSQASAQPIQSDGTQESSTQELNSAAQNDLAASAPVTASEPPSTEARISLLPIFAMALGVTVVLTLMIGLKSHAFVALILGALTISFFVPNDVVGFQKSPPQVIKADSPSHANIINRVTSSLGGAVSGIGVLIAMAAIIGKCMLVSGAADRIVRSTVDLLGEKRAALAMMVSGFILSVPVFFDTVFYLLVPLARSLYRTTQKNYLLYLAAIAAGGAITHTLVPPTPGPLLVAEAFKVDIGLVMMIGIAVGIPSSLIGLIAAHWLDKKMPIVMRPMSGSSSSAEGEITVLPSLPMALVPVLLPVVLITVETVLSTIWKSPETESAKLLLDWFKLLGNANFAMIFAALFSIFLCWKVQGHSLKQLAEHIEDSLLSGGVIILITAAGGAFGSLLGMTEIQTVVASLFGNSQSSGSVVMFVAFGLAAALKVAQGSSTVAMIIASSLVASIAQPLAAAGTLGFHLAYLVPVIGAGSLMGSWMNDSGFWVFAKMGVLTEGETLKSWTILLCILSVSGFVFTYLLAMVLPMA